MFNCEKPFFLENIIPIIKLSIEEKNNTNNTGVNNKPTAIPRAKFLPGSLAGDTMSINAKVMKVIVGITKETYKVIERIFKNF